ncbi:MAG TPA: TetR family transcriptional regulator [Candidatus Eremiobacteraceae bacterium]|nr:TetR family transcriptional regulator [Candidatus Eremiobacteraceae bacterium]
MASRKRDYLLSVAQRLFCTRGFHAVSVDTIIAEAGVARMTVYKNFASKDDLMLETLRREDKEFRQWLVSTVEKRALRPADRIAAMFDGLHERFSATGYYGCPFIRVSVEFPDASHPVHKMAREHKEMIRSYIRGLVSQLSVANPVQVSEQIYLLFEGALTASQLNGEPWPAEFAKQAALRLIANTGHSKARAHGR